MLSWARHQSAITRKAIKKLSHLQSDDASQSCFKSKIKRPEEITDAGEVH